MEVSTVMRGILEYDKILALNQPDSFFFCNQRALRTLQAIPAKTLVIFITSKKSRLSKNSFE